MKKKDFLDGDLSANQDLNRKGGEVKNATLTKNQNREQVAISRIGLAHLQTTDGLKIEDSTVTFRNRGEGGSEEFPWMVLSLLKKETGNGRIPTAHPIPEQTRFP